MRDVETRRAFVSALAGTVAVGLAGCSDSIPSLSDSGDTEGDSTSTTESPVSDESTPGAGGGGDGTSTPAGAETQAGEERDATPDGYSVPFTRSGFEAEVKRQINEFRSANDERELQYDELYREGVRQHSEVMATAGEASLDVDGKSAPERVQDKTNCLADSNVARLRRPESRDAAATRVVERWAQDDESREKMLRSYHNQIGVGAAITEAGDVYVTAAFC